MIPPAAPTPGPPTLPRLEDSTAKLRRATLANLMLPGAGLYLIGQKRLGVCLASVFSICFVGVLGIFLSGYVNYFKVVLAPDVMQGDKLERLGDGFHLPWVLALAAGGVVVYALGIVLFIRARARA